MSVASQDDAREPVDGDGREGGVHAGGRCAAGVPGEDARPDGAIRVASAPDADAEYERVIRINAGVGVDGAAGGLSARGGQCAAGVATGGDQVQQAVLGQLHQRTAGGFGSGRVPVGGPSVHPRTRLLVIPASQEMYLEAMRLGYLGALIEAGAMINPPGCGPCVGVHQGILAAGENCISQYEPQFHRTDGEQGFGWCIWRRPAVVAASAIAGAYGESADGARGGGGMTWIVSLKFGRGYGCVLGDNIDTEFYRAGI